MRLACLALAAFLSLPWTAIAQPATGAAATAAPVPAPRQYLWEVSSLTNRVYLYGTVHAGKASFFPLAEPVQKAFADAKVLAVEADILNVEAMTKSSSTMVLVPPDRLDKRLPAPVYERFRRQLERFGLQEQEMAKLKPFIASSYLAFSEWGRLGYSPRYGVDRHLLVRAREAKMDIVELEGVANQAALMNSLTDAESRQALEGTLMALESGLTREQITGMVNAWQSGDANLLLEVARAYNESVPGARELEEKFIWSRHEAMAERIEEWLMRGRERVFVAVGALHLAGPRGLVEMLAKRGYQVRQL